MTRIKVTFFAGSAKIGTVKVTAGADPNTGFANATASLTITSLPVGADTITGDKNYTVSTGTVTVTITAAP